MQALAALIKLYLRELPDDVWAGAREQIDALPSADCVSGWGEGDGKPEELHGIIQSIVYQLDPSGADLVVWVCDVMVAVVAKEESNRMNVGAASTVFAPGLVHAPISAEAHPVALMMASEKGVQLTTYLLRAHMFKKLLAVRPTSKMEDEGAATVVDVSDAGGGGRLDAQAAGEAAEHVGGGSNGGAAGDVGGGSDRMNERMFESSTRCDEDLMR